MHQLESIYNSPFKDSYSHPVHTCFAMIASNAAHLHREIVTQSEYHTNQKEKQVSE